MTFRLWRCFLPYVANILVYLKYLKKKGEKKLTFHHCNVPWNAFLDVSIDAGHVMEPHNFHAIVAFFPSKMFCFKHNMHVLLQQFQTLHLYTLVGKSTSINRRWAG